MNRTIVSFVEKQTSEEISPDFLRIFRIYCPNAMISYVAESEEDYVILKLSDGRICTLFDNEMQAEPLEAKVTLTGLQPHTVFDIRVDGDVNRQEERIANLAGILEFRYDIPAGKTAVVLSRQETMR